ncbi:hypothetical protein JXB01_02575 [Candidatus Micrarchaeota archaeon]|nr:hypothetical protein [Candidatus Micrarchaeota archaeon]
MDPYQELLNLFGKDETEKKIKLKIDEFHGYVSRDVAVKVIAKESGVYKEEENFIKIKEINEGLNNVNVRAVVDRIMPLKVFPSGKKCRIIILKDETGTAELWLWEEDTRLAYSIMADSKIQITGAYINGGHLNTGYKGKIKILSSAKFTEFSGLKEGTVSNIKGIVSRVEGMKSFEKEGRKKTFYSFVVSDGDTEKKVIVWENPGRVGNIEEQDRIVIENARFKDGTLHANTSSRIFVKRPRNIIKGEIKDIKLKGERTEIEIGEKKINLNMEDTLKFLGVEQDKQVSLSTILELKKDSVIGKEAVISKNNEGRIQKVVMR